MADSGISSGIFSDRISFGPGDIEAGSSNGDFGDTERKASVVEASIDKTTDGQNNNDGILDFEKWAGSLSMILADLPHYMCEPGHPGRINRIPENIRQMDLKAYEPFFLSVGPYHHGEPLVQAMEERKKISLKCFLQKNPDVTLKDCLMEIESIESTARSFYTEIEMESENFVLMLLLDSFYIVTSLCGVPQSKEMMNRTNTGSCTTVNNDTMDESYNMWASNHNERVYEQGIETTTDYSVQPTWFWTFFMHDILLLENQLPFFLLQKIYKFFYGGSEAQFIDILKDVLGDMLSNYNKLDADTVVSPTENVQHLLHLCHIFFRPTIQQETTTCQLTESNQMFRLGSVAQLYQAGVSFKARPRSTQQSLLDITFGSSGIMIMPCLCVDDNTASLLRNLIALEQMKYPSMGLNVSSYAVLLLHLITTPDDVKLLMRKGIIQHHLASDKEMMQLINRLSVGLSFDYVGDSYSLKSVFQELNRYTGQKARRGRAWLKHRYFSNPWTPVSLFAASFLLLLTAVQTYYSVHSYYHPFFNRQS